MTAAIALPLAVGLLVACGPDGSTPGSSGWLVGHMSGTSDVAGQSGNPAVGGGGLAVLPIAVMDSRFWELTEVEPVANPSAWAVLRVRLTGAQVSRLGGAVVSVDDKGDFRLQLPPEEYAFCYWPSGTDGWIWGCGYVELPSSGKLKASWGEAGFHIGVVD